MTIEQQKEVEMEETTEQTTLEEKADITEQVATPEPEPVSEEGTALEAEATPEPISETPVSEVSSEDEATTKKLAEEVKAKLLVCSEDSNCLDALSARFEEMAIRLGVPTERLINEVFALLTHKGS